MNIHGKDYELEVSVQLDFEGSHALPTRPELHDHFWRVEFGVSGPLDPNTGMVYDMLILSRFFKPFVDELNGKNLHEFKGFEGDHPILKISRIYPTCDSLCHYFMWRVQPEFEAEKNFKGLRISHIRVGISEPDGGERWGEAVLRPK